MSEYVPTTEEVRAERDDALARIAEVEKLHRLEPVISTGFPPLEPGSAYCSQGCQWPCATRTVLGLPLTLGLNEGENE